MNLRQLRQQANQVVTFALVLSSAFMVWKLLSVATNSESPIVVVLSGSMEPAFQRGDILFLHNRDKFVHVGDVVVYKVQDKTIPIVHRVMNEHHVVKEGKSKQLLLTKGDNNPVNDLSLYSKNQVYLNREDDIIGTVKGYVPVVGYITILITEKEYLKYGLIAFMGISSLLSNEE